MPVEITWWGHATCTVEDSGRPCAHRPAVRAPARASAPPPRARCPRPRPRSPTSSLVSHLHADHLHVPSLARLAPGTRLLVPAGRAARGARAAPAARTCGSTEVAPGDARPGRRPRRTGRARAARRAAAAGAGRTAPPRSGMWWRARPGPTSPGTPGCSTRWRRRSGAVDVALLPVGRLGAVPRARGIWTRGGPPRRWPGCAAQRRAGALRHVLADRHGRRAPARIPRAGRRVRAAAPPRWRPRWRCTGSSTARACGRRSRGEPGRAAGVRGAIALLVAAATPRRRSPRSRRSAIRRCSCWCCSARWCRWCRRGRWSARRPWWPSTRRRRSRCCWCSWWRRVAAFLGDVALYWLGRRGMGSKNGSRWLAAIRARAPEERLAQAQEKLARPRRGGAGAVPAGAGRADPGDAGLPAGRDAAAAVRPRRPARRAWPGRPTYQVIGILGGSLFREPWQGVVAAVALTLVISAAPARVAAAPRGRPRQAASRGTPWTGAHRQVPQVLAGQARLLPGGPHPGQRLQHRLGGEHERRPVHRRHPAGAQVLRGPHRLLRVAVDVAEPPARFVGADGQQGQVDAGVAAADLGRTSGRSRCPPRSRRAARPGAVSTQPPHRVRQVSVRLRLDQWWAGTKSKRTPSSSAASHQSSSVTRVNRRRRNQRPSPAGTNTGVSRGSRRRVGASRWS